LFLAGSVAASATPILDSWAIGIDGSYVISGDGSTIPAAVAGIGPLTDITSAKAFAGANFDTSNPSVTVSGIGDIVIQLTGTGTHTVVAWLKYHFSDNPYTWQGDYGGTVNTPNGNESWRIDDYSYVADYFAAHGTFPVLDDANHLPAANLSGDSNTYCCDVVLGFGLTGNLDLSGNSKNFPFLIRYAPSGESGPNLGNNFALTQQHLSSDGDLGTIYLFTPEPGTWMLICGALAVFVAKVKVRR
jgi:hypothetical protein